MRVLRSDDDYLFLVGGTNDVVRLFSAPGFERHVPVAPWRDRLAERRAFFARLGIPWCQLIVPEKLSVLGGTILARQVAGAAPPAVRLLDALQDPALIYPRAFFRQQVEHGYALYPRTDSHWSSLGAFSAFQWLLPHFGLNLDFSPYLATRPHALVYRGDLWGDGYPGFAEEVFERRAVPSGIERVHANDLVRLKERTSRENDSGLHVGCHVAYRNEAAERPERLVLFGTSFSDYRLDCSLLTFIATLFFREVHFVWSTSLDMEFIRDLAPDLAICEIPERFLCVCPDDRFDVADHSARIIEAASAAA